MTLPSRRTTQWKSKKKKDKYLDVVRELKNYETWKMTVILIEKDALETVSKVLVRGLKDLEIRGRVDTMQIIEYWEEL